MTVGEMCTRSVATVRPGDTVLEAAKRMREWRVAGLVVTDESQRAVGILTDRDVRLVESIADPEETLVEEAMTPEPYVVQADAFLRDVAREMSQHKYGCAVVLERGAVVGIFTTIDALRALLEVEHELTPPSRRFS